MNIAQMIPKSVQTFAKFSINITVHHHHSFYTSIQTLLSLSLSHRHFPFPDFGTEQPQSLEKNMEKNEAYGFGSGFDPVPAPFSAPPPMGRTGAQSIFIPSSFRVPPQPVNNYHTTPNTSTTFQAPLLLPVPTTTAYSGSDRVTELGENDLDLIGSGSCLIGDSNENGDVQIRKRRNVALQKPRSSFSFPASGSYKPHVPSPFPARVIDRTRLTFLFEKELQKSDVSRLQRIVLPKKAAESYLPELENKNGFVITMDDMEGTSWKFKLRYWFNNKSRMYVLENTGAFVRKHGLRSGDSILLHRECLSHNYVIEARKQSFTKDVNTSKPTNVGHSQAASAPVSAPAAFEAGGTEDHVYIDHAETNVKEHQLIYDLKVYNPNLDDTSMSFNYNHWRS